MYTNGSLSKKSKGRNAARTSTSLPSMSVIGSAKPKVLLIKVYKTSRKEKCLGYENGNSKNLCIDPSLACFRALKCLISHAFDLKTEFTINAVEKCPSTGLERSTAIWSDWDVQDAIGKVKSGSYLRLCYELTEREDGLDDWDLIPADDFSSSIRCINVDSTSIIATVKPIEPKKPSALKKTINIICGANDRRIAKPIGLSDLSKFVDDEGRLIHPNELRQAIYESGIESAARNVIWRYLLNIFSMDMTNTERNTYLDDVKQKYDELKKRWKQVEHPNEKIRAIMRAIRTDVVRTDRTFEFYSTTNNSSNANIEMLFNILVTFAISHPTIPYCQGMNEYASILLYVMRDESLAYLCFCSIMRRVRENFSIRGITIATKFQHLTVLLRAYDPVYWNLLETCDAANLYFTYRWLLLECKREFSFKESLRVLEVMWATLPIENEPIELCENDLLPVTPDINISNNHSNTLQRLPSDDNRQRAMSCPPVCMTEPSTRRKFRQYSHSVAYSNRTHLLNLRTSSIYQHDFYSTANSDEQQFHSSITYNPNLNSFSTKNKSKGFENSYSLNEISGFDSELFPTKPSIPSSQNSATSDWLERLPKIQIWLENDNSFLLFLCIAILCSHRQYLVKQKTLDQQDIAMHFDQHRRRHSAEKMLSIARNLYEEYIQFARKQRMLDDLNLFSVS